ncbi:MAG: ACP S-malonyltransferase [Phycisphaerales bacterium]
MSEKLIILFPGQGAQHVGMGRLWAEKFDVSRKVFSRADDVLGFGLSKVCFEGPESEVTRTDIAQAAIYTTSVACCEALKEQGVIDPAHLVATAGLSLGEYTALYMAGAFSFEDGLMLVRQRGSFMQEAAVASPSSMVALIGADETQANQLCDEARGSGVLVPANFNCPGQVVVSGSKDACERALTVAAKMGLKAAALTVAGAFHSPLMQPAADHMAAALDKANWNLPTVPVMSNVTGSPHSNDIASIKKRLVAQITQSVRWTQDVQWLIANVPGARFVEPAPGKVLSGLMRRINKAVKVETFAEPAPGNV